MSISDSILDRDDRASVRKATERLLAWGFSAPCIARELGCSTSYVEAVRRELARPGGGDDERYLPPSDPFSPLGR